LAGGDNDSRDNKSTEEKTIFLFGLGEIVTSKILNIFFLDLGSSTSSLHMLCSMRLVCRAWRYGIDDGHHWSVVKMLYHEDVETMNKKVWDELEQIEDKEKDKKV
jgi:hypothetical protein